MDKQDNIYKKITIITPENVSLELPLGVVGNRISCFLLDIIILSGCTAFLFIIVGGITSIISVYLASALCVIGSFVLWNGYFIYFELKRGSTPGKKTHHYKVIMEDGTSLSPASIYIRNIMRETEIWMPLRLTIYFLSDTVKVSDLPKVLLFLWMILCIFVPFFDKKNRRIGDLLAGTVVVTIPEYKLEKDLVLSTPKEGKATVFHFTQEMLDIYGKEELQVLEQILRGQEACSSKEREKLAAKLADKISNKIQYPEKIDKRDHMEFLQQFYNAQREVLEKKLVRGESLKRRTQRWGKKLRKP